MMMGKSLASSQLELARNNQRNASVNMIGQISGPMRTYSSGVETNNALFSKSHGSAWDNALRVAEELLQGTQKAPHGPVPVPPAPVVIGSRRSTSSPSGLDQEYARPLERALSLAEEERTEVSLDSLIDELEAAEEDSKASASQWQGVVEKSQMDDPGGHAHAQRLTSSTSSAGSGNGNYELRTAGTGGLGRDRRSSDSESVSHYGGSGVSEEVISERAAQWGYGVVLKNSRSSTPRTSNGSAGVGGGAGLAIPGVSSTIKDALTSFQLAFLVCDATHQDFPILYASAGFTTMTGYAGDEIVGRNCRFLQGADTDRLEVARLREALKNGSTYTGTILNYKKDGTPFWNLLTISPIKDDAGNVIKYIGMQAEQNSKEQQQRRKSEGQRSVEGRPLQPLQPLPSGIPVEALDETHGHKVKHGGARAAASAPSSRRHSSGSNSLPKPPVAPQRSLPGERHSAGPELHLGEAPKRMSQRYSLSSNPARSSRTSSIIREGSSQSDWRDAALKLRVGVEGGKKTSFFESSVATSSTAELTTQKSRSGRLTARILRLFRKPFKESKRSSEPNSSAKQGSSFSDSDEEEGDEVNSSDFSARNSRTHPRSSGVFSSSGDSGPSGPRSFTRPDATINAYDLRNKLKEHLNENSHNESPRAPPLDISKQQFCIVHS